MRFVYLVDLTCAKCRGPMRVISSIKAPSVIKAILNHLGIWLIGSRTPAKLARGAPLLREYTREVLSAMLGPDEAKMKLLEAKELIASLQQAGES